MKLQKLDEFPAQYPRVGQTVQISFPQTKKRYAAKVLRDDVTKPFQTVLQLEDGRVLFGTECEIVQ